MKKLKHLQALRDIAEKANDAVEANIFQALIDRHLQMATIRQISYDDDAATYDFRRNLKDFLDYTKTI